MSSALEHYVAHIDDELAAAWAALCGARAAANRSPNAANLAVADKAQHKVDDLLDRRLRVMHVDAMPRT